MLEIPNFVLEIHNTNIMKSIIKEIFFALTLIIFLIVSILYYSTKLDWSILNISVAVLSFVTVILFTWLLKNRVKDIQKGSVLEDEMTKKIKVYAGYYSFIGSSFLYGVIFIVANLNHLKIDAKSDGILAFGLFGSSIIYFAVYLYLKKAGKFYE